MSSNNTDNDDEKAIQAERAKSGFYFTEECNPGVKMEIQLKSILHSSTSPYQSIQVVETYYGTTLITDGKTQSAKFDEFVYHESLVHPALFQSRILNRDGKQGVPSTVFIGGGGELATAREVLRHKSVTRVVMVDLDEAVINVCKTYLPEWGGETVANDPRLELVVGDAYAYLMNTEETFDVIIMDISDPIEAGPGIMLYTREFYEHAITRLNMPHGVFVTQAGTADIVLPPNDTGDLQNSTCYGPILNTLGSVFDCSIPYSTNIPSFGSDWAFVMAFQAQDQNVQDVVQETCVPSTGVVDNMISDCISGGPDALRHYDGVCHVHMFALPKALRKELKKDERVMTKDNPIFMY